MTGGHPYANDVVITEVRHWEGQVTPEIFSEREARSTLGDLRPVHSRICFQGSLSRLQAACELMALVRIFDTTMLRRVLQICRGDLFGHCEQEDFGDLLLGSKEVTVASVEQRIYCRSNP